MLFVHKVRSLWKLIIKYIFHLQFAFLLLYLIILLLYSTFKLIYQCSKLLFCSGLAFIQFFQEFHFILETLNLRLTLARFIALIFSLFLHLLMQVNNFILQLNLYLFLLFNVEAHRSTLLDKVNFGLFKLIADFYEVSFVVL